MAIRHKNHDLDKKSFTIEYDNETEAEQILVIIKALYIFSKKNKKYSDGWKCYGSYGAAFFIKDRANRIWRMMKAEQKLNPEDALDLVNLAVFAIRSQDENNVGGEYWGDDTPGTKSLGEQEEQAVCAMCGGDVTPCPDHPQASIIPLSYYLSSQDSKFKRNIDAVRAVWGSSGYSPDEKLDRIGRLVDGDSDPRIRHAGLDGE